MDRSGLAEAAKTQIEVICAPNSLETERGDSEATKQQLELRLSGWLPKWKTSGWNPSQTKANAHAEFLFVSQPDKHGSVEVESTLTAETVTQLLKVGFD